MRNISVADYIIEFFISCGITDVFGYQGGMVCHLFDSLGLYKGKINYHCCGNEQGAALAACGYAQATGKLGVCITTSGPGFTNALTGLANAWFDSIPLMLISGQVNTKDKRRGFTIRQYGFQEMQTIDIVKSITKKAYEIDDDTNIITTMNDAYITAFEGRRGPVFLDLPINICRNTIRVNNSIVPVFTENRVSFDASTYVAKFMSGQRPVIIVGAGINQLGLRGVFRELIEYLKIPVVFTMPGVDLLPYDSPYRVGFIGGTARREAGIVLKHTDSVLSLGTRLCNKAIGYDHEDFIPQAKVFIRVDIDTAEFERKLKDCEIDLSIDLRTFIFGALDYIRNQKDTFNHEEWVHSVTKMQKIMAPIDVTFGNKLVERFTQLLPSCASITLDVGNNQVYGAQSSVIKKDTRLYASCGLGAMGYAIPSAIGVAIGSKTKTYVITGDGGAQMNIQELNIIGNMKLPIKILVLNNHALGHIVLFQEHYLDNRFVATKEEYKDYYSCDFSLLAEAYGIRAYKVHAIEELEEYMDILNDEFPALFEMEFENCPLLPNIHGGLDPLTHGPILPKEICSYVKELFK